MARSPTPEAPSVSRDLERWLEGDGEKVLGSLVELFEEKSFAILFVVLLSLGVLLEDFVVVVVGLVIGVAGVVLEVVLGAAAINALKTLF